jgi:hypothetical protein
MGTDRPRWLAWWKSQPAYDRISVVVLGVILVLIVVSAVVARLLA